MLTDGFLDFQNMCDRVVQLYNLKRRLTVED